MPKAVRPKKAAPVPKQGPKKAAPVPKQVAKKPPPALPPPRLLPVRPTHYATVEGRSVTYAVPQPRRGGNLIELPQAYTPDPVWHILAETREQIDMTLPHIWFPHTYTQFRDDVLDGHRSLAGLLFGWNDGIQQAVLYLSRSINTQAGLAILPFYEGYVAGGPFRLPSMILMPGTPTGTPDAADATPRSPMSLIADDDDLPPSPSPVAGERSVNF